MALQSDHCENSEIYCTIEDFCVQSPNEIVSRSSVARMRCPNESGSLHV